MGDPRGQPAGLMSLLMIHKAYMPLYKGSRFLVRVDGSTRGPRGPKNIVHSETVAVAVPVAPDRVVQTFVSFILDFIFLGPCCIQQQYL